MKINPVNAAIASAASILIAYGLYNIDSNINKLTIAFGSLILILATLIPLIGFSFDLPRTGINVRMISGLFFLIFLGSSLFFSFFGTSLVSYVVVHGILLLLYIFVGRSIFFAKQ